MLGWMPFVSRTAHAAEVAPPFTDYYARYQGLRVLGLPLGGLTQVEGYPAQYFEKGRIEDHRKDGGDPAWQFAYGRLAAELMERAPTLSVSTMSVTYNELRLAAGPSLRMSPPSGFTGGTRPVQDGMFVPFDAQLRPAPGYAVASYFWAYINRLDLFPGGWPHDVGLPMTAVFNANVVKSNETRTIFVQAFERTVLTYDPKNPTGWQVERGNIGADALSTLNVVGGRIELPTPNSTVTMPIHIVARGGTPGERVTVTLRWEDGIQLSHTFELLRGEDGRGLLVTNFDWLTEGPPPTPTTNKAVLQIHTNAGGLIAEQPLTVFQYNDPTAQSVKLYWYIDEELVESLGRFPRTTEVGTAALQELLWGPTPGNLADFSTAIPTPEEVLAYSGRGPDWGHRVTLKKLTIENGVATADFSKEMLAYGGGAARVAAIRTQITRTLEQFPSIRQVRILVEGDPDALQP
jgi:hypothetical protein